MKKHDWREAMQKWLDDNNRLRELSIVRVGDYLTETKPCLEGAGRAREVMRCQQDEVSRT